jgi:hypothetical protein
MNLSIAPPYLINFSFLKFYSISLVLAFDIAILKKLSKNISTIVEKVVNFKYASSQKKKHE